MREFASVTSSPSGLNRRSPWWCRSAPPGSGTEQAKSEQEQAETAAYGEDDDHPGHQRRADGAWREPDGQESPGKAHDQNRERDRIDRALNSVHRRRRRRFHLSIKPRKDIALTNAPKSIAAARVLPCAGCECLDARATKWGECPSFQRDRILLLTSYKRRPDSAPRRVRRRAARKLVLGRRRSCQSGARRAVARAEAEEQGGARPGAGVLNWACNGWISSRSPIIGSFR